MGSGAWDLVWRGVDSDLDWDWEGLSLGFIDLRPPSGETFPAQDYSFNLGLLVYHSYHPRKCYVQSKIFCFILGKEALPYFYATCLGYKVNFP